MISHMVCGFPCILLPRLQTLMGVPWTFPQSPCLPSTFRDLSVGLLFWASLVAQTIGRPPAMRETQESNPSLLVFCIGRQVLYH